MNSWSRKIWAVTALAALGCLLTIGSAGAWDPEDMKKLRDTNACSGCDLTLARLSDANLIGADLSGANLSGANLARAILLSANLSKANLSGANLAGTNLKGANLSGTTWTDGRQCAEGSFSECK